eukprot:10373291-Prorocentrum_lima.AAC.1
MQAPYAFCFADIAAVFNTTIPTSIAHAIDERTLLNFIENAEAQAWKPWAETRFSHPSTGW